MLFRSWFCLTNSNCLIHFPIHCFTFIKCDNLEELLLKATEPRFLYKALVSYEERSLAKNAGFRWNTPVQGAWSRKLTNDEAKNLDFRVEILN